ncbi:MAG TPA: GNAT family N-acetyltransferase [Gemmatimonadaceae bacterium]
MPARIWRLRLANAVTVTTATPRYSIRLARATDVPELARLFSELGYEIAPDVLAERWGAFAASGEQGFVAADDASPHGRLLGLVTLHATPVLHRAGPVGRVTALVVDATFRGCGIGRALMAAAERWAAERGCVLLEVTSNQRRVDAHKFYEGLGFERTSFRFARAPRADAAPSMIVTRDPTA